jgi:hypothetical protein
LGAGGGLFKKNCSPKNVFSQIKLKSIRSKSPFAQKKFVVKKMKSKINCDSSHVVTGLLPLYLPTSLILHKLLRVSSDGFLHRWNSPDGFFRFYATLEFTRKKRLHEKKADTLDTYLGALFYLCRITCRYVVKLNPK